MEMVIAITTVLVIPKSSANCCAAGETIEEEMGEMKVNADTIETAAHLRRVDQL